MRRRTFIKLASGLLVPASCIGLPGIIRAAQPPLFNRDKPAAVGGGSCTTPSDLVANPQAFYNQTSETVDWLAGEYTATAKTNCAADLYLIRVGNPGGSMELRIYNNSTASPGTQVGSSSNLVTCASVGTTVGYISFSGFSATTTAATHWIVLRFTDISTHDNMNYIGWSLSNDSLTASSKNSEDGTTWATVDDPQCVFRLFTA